MYIYIGLFIVLTILIIITLNSTENFDLDSYLRSNYESGANMLRGDLPIEPVQQSWFNTRYGPSNLVKGYFEGTVV
jgi:hypothetical protein